MRRPVAVRVVGPVQWIFIPALVALAVTIVLATPVELFGLNLPEPVIPMVLAFAWPLIRPSVTAPLLLTLLGLSLDILTYGPLGLWALALLAIWYAACCGLAFLVAYLVVTLIARNPPSLLALIGQVAPTLLLFPFADRMIERFEDGDVRFR
jgi:rod shape-determining protein MreD